MENIEDFCVSHKYAQRYLLLLHRPPPAAAAAALLLLQQQQPLPSPSSSSAAAAAAASAAAIALEFHPKHATNKNKTKHIMKILHINVNIYDKTAKSQQNSD
jgi:hypothetical protein